VLCSPSKDDMQILSLLHGIQPYGGCTFGHGIKVAMLALRHRLNKHGAQRIIVFVGSPVNDDDRSLKTLADTLRKNNVRQTRKVLLGVALLTLWLRPDLRGHHRDGRERHQRSKTANVCGHCQFQRSSKVGSHVLYAQARNGIVLIAV
jgi:hypothetical protein